MNIMQCALHPIEFFRVSSCTTTREMWDKLQVIYEGEYEVRETKANMLIFEYVAFRMKDNESVSEMYARLTVLTNGLKSLGKNYTEYELVRIILRSLTLIWHTKAIVIEELRNLSSTTVDELIGSLMTYELNLKRSKESEKKKKTLALKASPSYKEPSMNGESSSSKEDSSEFAMFTKKFKKFLKGEGKNYKRKPFNG